MRRLIPTTSLAALTAALFLMPVASKAAFFAITDTDPTGITFNVNDFENGFSVNGSLIQIGIGNPGSVTVPEENGAASFTGSWIDLGQSMPTDRTIYFVEEDNPTAISDIFHYTLTTDGFSGTISGFFQSDGETSLGTLPMGTPPQNIVVEGPGAQFMVSEAAFLETHISSDFRAVPEPAGMTLLGTGLVALLGHTIRRRKRAVA